MRLVVLVLQGLALLAAVEGGGSVGQELAASAFEACDFATLVAHTARGLSLHPIVMMRYGCWMLWWEYAPN